MDKYIKASSKLDGKAKEMWLEAIPTMAKTDKLNDLDAQGLYATLIGFLCFAIFGCLEFLNIVLPGEFFLVQGYNPLIIHLGFFGGLAFGIAGVVCIKYVEKQFGKL